MLLSSMDHLNYYSMPKESFLQLDGGVGAPDGYDLAGDEPYLNEENSPKNGTKSSLYKTELCKRFSEFGNCRYGAKCQFAHGIAELRHVVRHPKYKTTKCKSYWGSGHCPYGSRCRFIHEETESYAAPQYSPQGAMGSMFGDVGLGALGGGELGGAAGLSAASSSYLYGGGEHLAPAHHHAHHPAHLGGGGGLAPYGGAKDYALLSPFDKGAWGPSGRGPKLGYAGELHAAPAHHAPAPHHAHHHSAHHASAFLGGLPPLASPTHHAAPHLAPLHARHLSGSAAPAHAPLHRRHSSGGAPSAGGAQASYPDLQDAIDALMKFSLTHDDEDDDGAARPLAPAASAAVTGSAVAAVGSAAVGPAESATGSAPTESDASASASASASAPASVVGGKAKKTPADLALEADELWKDFPAPVEPLDASSWSASGLVLNLDAAKAFDGGEKKGGSGSGSEHSPRLSVFERFH